jgi:hypothetical protein
MMILHVFQTSAIVTSGRVRQTRTLRATGTGLPTRSRWHTLRGTTTSPTMATGTSTACTCCGCLGGRGTMRAATTTRHATSARSTAARQWPARQQRRDWDGSNAQTHTGSRETAGHMPTTTHSPGIEDKAGWGKCYTGCLSKGMRTDGQVVKVKGAKAGAACERKMSTKVKRMKYTDMFQLKYV